MENLTPEQVVEKINGLFTEKMANVPTNEEVNGLKKEVDALKSLTEKSAEIEKAIAKFEGRIEAMSEKAIETREVAPRTIGQAVRKSLKDNHKAIVSAMEKGETINLDVKTDTTITGDYTGDVALSVLDPIVDRIKRPIRRVQEIANVGTTTSKYVVYIQQTTASTSSFIAEAGSKAQGQVQYQEVSVEVKKVAATLKVSKEMLTDLSFMQSEVNYDLMESVEQSIDNALLNGNGVGANLDGVINQSTAWSAGSFAGTITNANVSDVIRVGKAQIESANFTPTHVILNPEDVAKIQLTKTTQGEYTYPIFMDAMGGMTLSGMIVVSSANMTADNFVIGDFSRFNVRYREALNMSIGYVNDDFQRNMVTILCEARLVSYIKANDQAGFVTGDFTTAIAAL
ncbi:MAG: phage major capsid protein [Rhodobacteraceae bacterium]|jgi:HK97 family phage major capsid protein|nr:phage major capsid protein [Paracoccaceae bacterium]